MYRAKRKDNNEWTYGYYYKIWDKHYLLWGMTNDVPNMIEVYEDTVCRMIDYRKDDNEKDIYLNDIVLCESGEGCMGYREYSQYFIVDDYHFTMASIQECENVKVVGNIYDNKELIKKCVNGGLK